MNLKKNKQGGFALISVVIAAIGLMAILLAVIANSRTPGVMASDTAKPAAAGLLMQANNLATGFDMMISRGNSTASKITYDYDATNGIFNSSLSSLVPQVPPPAALVTTGQRWMYRKNDIKYNSIGTAAADYSFVLGDVTQATCDEFNKQANNYTGATPSSAAASAAVWPSNSAGADLTKTGTAVDLSAQGVAGWSMGCLATTGNSNYFVYVVVSPQ